jgi:hypothetical protein
VKSFSLRLAGSPSFYRRVAPAPYFVVTVQRPPSFFIADADTPIVYLSSRRLWRVTIDGSSVWLDVPRSDGQRLRHATRHLRPYPAPRTWAAAAGG